jgi:hypothetical protein
LTAIAGPAEDDENSKVVRRFKCPFCGKTYADNGHYMYNHMAIKHFSHLKKAGEWDAKWAELAPTVEVVEESKKRKLR